MRLPGAKKERSPMPFGATNSASVSPPDKRTHLTPHNETTCASDTTIIASSTPSHDRDVNALTDDEVRERFKSVMVC